MTPKTEPGEPDAAFNPCTQHPYEIGATIAAVDAAPGGRAYLGLARGSHCRAGRAIEACEGCDQEFTAA